MSAYASKWIIWLWMPFAVSSLQCWKCDSAIDNEDCQLRGQLENCANEESVCSTEVRTTFGQVRMWKQCKQRGACQSQRIRNWGKTAVSSRCNKGGLSSHCWCCCDTDSCNLDETCRVTADECKRPPVKLTHGEVTCSNGNKVGSVCRRRCTKAGFQIYPPTTQDSICLGNGQWSDKKPCCARPCPPYFSVIHVSLLQFNTLQSFQRRVENTHGGFTDLIAKEYNRYRNFQITFGDEVYSDMEAGKGDRDFPDFVASNKTNTGKALQYIMQKGIFPSTREDHHSAFLLLAVESSSDDDVATPARTLKEAGATIYYIFYESPEHKVDMNEAKAVASSNETIFVVNDTKTTKNFENLLSGIVKKLCANPCPIDVE